MRTPLQGFQELLAGRQQQWAARDTHNHKLGQKRALIRYNDKGRKLAGQRRLAGKTERVIKLSTLHALLVLTTGLDHL